MADAVNGIAVEIRQGNIGNDHIPIKPAKDLFPADSFGGGNKGMAGKTVTVTLVPGDTIETDIAADKNILRVRGAAVRQFYHAIGAKDGSRIFIERTGARAFRISPIL